MRLHRSLDEFGDWTFKGVEKTHTETTLASCPL
jgi:hypothetical protein